MEPRKSIVMPVMIAVVLSGVVFGGLGYYLSNNKNAALAVTTTQTTVTTGKPNPSPTTIENLVKYSLANYGTQKTNIKLQFEIPDGYGAAMNQEGEGGLSIRYDIGKLAPENGNNVIRTSLSAPTRVTIIPSDSKLATLEDWYKVEPSDKPSAPSTKLSDITISDVKAVRYTVGGFGSTNLIQFVKNNTFYEIANETGVEEEVVAKIITTLIISN